MILMSRYSDGLMLPLTDGGEVDADGAEVRVLFSSPNKDLVVVLRSRFDFDINTVWCISGLSRDKNLLTASAYIRD